MRSVSRCTVPDSFSFSTSTTFLEAALNIVASSSFDKPMPSPPTPPPDMISPMCPTRGGIRGSTMSFEGGLVMSRHSVLVS